MTLACSADPVDPEVLFVKWVQVDPDTSTEKRIATVLKNKDPWVVDKNKWLVDQKTYELTLIDAQVSDTGLFQCQRSINNGTDVFEDPGDLIKVTITGRF